VHDARSLLGLRAYRQPEKLFNASGLNLPLTDVPIRLNQRLAADPCSPSLMTSFDAFG